MNNKTREEVFEEYFAEFMRLATDCAKKFYSNTLPMTIGESLELIEPFKERFRENCYGDWDTCVFEYFRRIKTGKCLDLHLLYGK